MAQIGCSLREHRLAHGYRALTLENQHLSVTLLPEKGADIYSFVYKPRKTDVLWKSPWGLKKPGTEVASSGASTEAAWLEHYEGGWQLIFPNGGDECRYKGAVLNFHGEASVLPWDYEVLRNSSSSVSVRSTTPDAFGEAAAAAAADAVAPAAGFAGGLVRLAVAARSGAAGSGFASPGPAMRRLTFSTTTALLRPWLKLWRTTPCSTPPRFSVSVLVAVTLSFSPLFFVVSVIPIQFRTQSLTHYACQLT